MRHERGTAVVEFALAFLLILTMALGTYEMGTAFLDKTAMANAAREGARAGSSAGDFDIGGGNDADCVVIEAAAGALQGMEGNDVRELWIYRTDSTGFVGLGGNVQIYKPDDGEGVDLTCGGGEWYRVANGWPPAQRELGVDEWLGVKLKVEHSWKTGFAWWNGTASWEEHAIMKLEPLPAR